MTSTTKPITLLRQRMVEDMRMRKLFPKTQAGYPCCETVRDLLGTVAGYRQCRRFTQLSITLGWSRHFANSIERPSPDSSFSLKRR